MVEGMPQKIQICMEKIMKDINKKIIDAVIEKAKQNCPESLDLIGIYGSVCTQDEHSKSDLDLLILINDDNGWQLSDCFILDDVQIGYDIYCTSWKMLEEDAECQHAHISKLMDSKIVYAANDSVIERLTQLKAKAADILKTEKRYHQVDKIQNQICKIYAAAMTADSIGKQREYAAYMISLSLDIVMLWNGKYFKYGIKRTFEEIEGLHLPEGFKENIENIVCARKMSEMNRLLTDLLRSIIYYTERDKGKAQPSKDALYGTYEETFSNWKNKMWEAIGRGDVFSSFMNMASFQVMLTELSDNTELPEFNIMNEFNPDGLADNERIFDEALEKYRHEYEKLGMKPRCFKNIDEFVKDFLS